MQTKHSITPFFTTDIHGRQNPQLRHQRPPRGAKTIQDLFRLHPQQTWLRQRSGRKIKKVGANFNPHLRSPSMRWQYMKSDETPLQSLPQPQAPIHPNRPAQMGPSHPFDPARLRRCCQSASFLVAAPGRRGRPSYRLSPLSTIFSEQSVAEDLDSTPPRCK